MFFPFVLLRNHIINYPTPLNLNYFYSFGSLSGFVLVSQLCTGVLLVSFFKPVVLEAFSSVEFIMRDINFGWLIRYLHSNGASFFFLAIYCHIARSLYYSSYHSERWLIWYSGLIIFILLMATAFMGYVLP